MDQVQSPAEPSWSALALRWTWPALVITAAADAILRRGGELCPQSEGMLAWWAAAADHLEAPFQAALVVFAAVHALALSAPSDRTALLDRNAQLLRYSALSIALGAFCCGAILLNTHATLPAHGLALIGTLLLVARAAPALRATLLLLSALALWHLLAHPSMNLTGPGLAEDLLQSSCLLRLAWHALLPLAHRARLLAFLCALGAALAAFLWPHVAATLLLALPLSASVQHAAVSLALVALLLSACFLGARSVAGSSAWCWLLLLLHLGSGAPLAAIVRALACLQWISAEAGVQSSGVEGGRVSVSGPAPGSAGSSLGSPPASAARC